MLPPAREIRRRLLAMPRLDCTSVLGVQRRDCTDLACKTSTFLQERRLPSSQSSSQKQGQSQGQADLDQRRPKKLRISFMLHYSDPRAFHGSGPQLSLIPTLLVSSSHKSRRENAEYSDQAGELGSSGPLPS